MLPRPRNIFLRAGRYAAVESAPEAARLALVLTGRVDRLLEDQKADPAEIKLLASNIYLQAAFACYLQGKMDEALTHANRAVELEPANYPAYVKLAKYLVLKRQLPDSVRILEHAIRADRNMIIITAEDTDLVREPQVIGLLENLRTEAAGKLAELINRLEEFMNSLRLGP